MKLCLIWKLHQPNGWHPRLKRYVLPWTRIQVLRSYMPLLRMAAERNGLPFTVAVSPDVLEYLERCTQLAVRDNVLDLRRKSVSELREEEVDELLAFAFQAPHERMIAQFPRFRRYWERAENARSSLRRIGSLFSTEELQDLQTLTPLAWFGPQYPDRLGEYLQKAQGDELFSPQDASALMDAQFELLGEFLEMLRKRCQRGEVEYLGGTLRHTIVSLLCQEDGFHFPEDARAQMVRGPRVHYRQFGKWPPVLHLTEGALCERTSALMKQACLHLGVASSRVLARTLGRTPSAAEVCGTWDFHGNCFAFTHAELSDQMRFVHPHLSVEEAVDDFETRVRAIARQSGSGSLLAEIDPALEAAADVSWHHRYWQALLDRISGMDGIALSRVDESMGTGERRPLRNIVGYTGRLRGFERFDAQSRPRFWNQLLQARQQFQNVRAWKTLPPEALSDARGSLFALESVDWMRCMDPGLDPWTQRKMEELLREHFDWVYRSLELTRPANFGEPFRPCETKVTSIGPSGPISPRVDGLRHSYHTWSGSGFFRSRDEGVCPGDSLRQISEVYYGTDGSHVYLRIVLPGKARELLRLFELQGVLHGKEGEQSVSWFRLRGGAEESLLDTRLAVAGAAREDEQPVAVVEEVADLRIPLASLGVTLGEVLRFQVSLWEQGNAVAAAPPLGWEEFVLEDPLARESFAGGAGSADPWQQRAG